MLHDEAVTLLVGAVALGAVHGVEPGHGWPVAAAYALERTNKWLFGVAASLLIGVGHLVSSLAMVAVFFYAKSSFGLTQLNEPITVFGGLQIGGPVSLVAGVLLILLGIREYAGHGHGHSHAGDAHEGPGHSHEGPDHDHDSDHGLDSAHTHEADVTGHDHEADVTGHDHEADVTGDGLLARVKRLLTGGGHSHDHGDLDQAADRGLLGIAWVAFLLGFAHEEEFEIIALCAGSSNCLELMSAYAITVVVAIVASTMLLVAGYTHYEERVEAYTPYLPVFSAAVLVLMGLGFITGLF
ncbi:MAG: hypothetical protein ABEJ67_06385 [Halanaeroarchaeum sp.]